MTTGMRVNIAMVAMYFDVVRVKMFLVLHVFIVLITTLTVWNIVKTISVVTQIKSSFS